MFSRISQLSKIIESTDKIGHSNEKKLWNNEINQKSSFDIIAVEILEFIPPPPRGKFIQDIIPDGLSTCNDLCSWASQDKGFFNLENNQESTRDISWVLLLLFVSICSAIFGAVIMVFTLKYKRNGSSMALIIQKPASGMNQNVDSKKNNESSNMDLTFFMEQEEEDIYATLDDRDSITSENINSFNKNVYIRNDETDIPLFSSAPSSAYTDSQYYSDLSHNEKAYENIESLDVDKNDKKDTGSSFITINHNHNRLSAISENNFGSHNNCNSDYV